MDLLLGGLDGVVLGAVALLLLVGATVGATRSATARRVLGPGPSPTERGIAGSTTAPTRRGVPTDTQGHPRRARAPGTA